MATLPYGVGSFGSGNASYGVGTMDASEAYPTMASQTELADLIESALLTPEEFAALPDKFRSPFGNYRLYASAWQMQRKGKTQAADAYSAAMAGEDVIPSAAATGGTSKKVGRPSARFSVDAKPGVSTDIMGESTRIPETATGRDLSGNLKFRIPEEETAYKQSEVQRKYDEAMFVPRMEEKATLEKTGQLQAKRGLAATERRLEEETKAADKDVYATIERLLKSKDTKDIAEGRRLKKEMDSVTESEEKRDFKRERDDKKYDQQMKVLDKKFGFAKELLADRNDMSKAMQSMTHDRRMEYLGVRLQADMEEMDRKVDEKSVEKSYASALEIARMKYDMETEYNDKQIKKYLAIGDEWMVRAAKANNVADLTEFENTVKFLEKQRQEGLQATKGGAVEGKTAPITPASQKPIPGYYKIMRNGKEVQIYAGTVEQAKDMIAKGAEFFSQY